MKVRVPRPAYI